MHTMERTFGNIQRKSMQGKPLLENELDFVQKQLHTSVSISALACGILLRDNGARADQKGQAKSILVELCSREFNDRSFVMDALTLVPIEELLTPQFKNFIYKTLEEVLTSNKDQPNVIYLCGRLAEHGDVHAKAMLQAAEGARNEYIKRQASNTLKRVAGSPDLVDEWALLIDRVPREKRKFLYEETKKYPSIKMIRFLTNSLEEELSFYNKNNNFDNQNMKSVARSIVEIWTNIFESGRSLKLPEANSKSEFVELIALVKSALKTSD